jgi:hypothetical protein
MAGYASCSRNIRSVVMVMVVVVVVERRGQECELRAWVGIN